MDMSTMRLTALEVVGIPTYVPGEVPDPTMAQVNQKPLKGEGLAEILVICKKANDMFMETLKGESFNSEIMKEYYTSICADILSERKRIGGDWAIAAFTMTREMRDHIR